MKIAEIVIAVSDREIVLPAEIGKKIGMKKGTRFILFKTGDSLILKKLELPTVADFEEMVEWGIKFAKEKGVKPEDVIEGD